MSDSSRIVIFQTVSNWCERAIRFSSFVTLVAIRCTEAQVEFFVIDICTRAQFKLKRECTDPGQFAVIYNWNLSLRLTHVTTKHVECAFPCYRAARVDLCIRAIFKAEIQSTFFYLSSQIRYDWYSIWIPCIQNQDWGQICCNWVSVFNLVSTGIIFRKQF